MGLRFVKVDICITFVRTRNLDFKSIIFQVTLKEEGVKGLARGWAPTAIGYSMQVSSIINGD